MSDLVVSTFGKIRRSKDIQFAEEAIRLKNSGDVWQVIEFLMKRWKTDAPDEVKAFKVYVDDTRDAQIDRKFGQTANKDQDRRLVVVFPYEIQKMIRSLYRSDELKLDKKFFAQFARRFPAFKIPELM